MIASERLNTYHFEIAPTLSMIINKMKIDRICSERESKERNRERVPEIECTLITNNKKRFAE
jgi:hypothetical protein